MRKCQATGNETAHLWYSHTFCSWPVLALPANHSCFTAARISSYQVHAYIVLVDSCPQTTGSSQQMDPNTPRRFITTTAGVGFPTFRASNIKGRRQKKLWKSSQAVGRDQRVPDPNPKYLSIPDPYLWTAFTWLERVERLANFTLTCLQALGLQTPIVISEINLWEYYLKSFNGLSISASGAQRGATSSLSMG